MMRCQVYPSLPISLSGGGSGINFEANAVAGVLSKAAAETW